MKASHLLSLTILFGLTTPSIARVQKGGRATPARTIPKSLGVNEEGVGSGLRDQKTTNRKLDLGGGLVVQRYVFFSILAVVFTQKPRLVCVSEMILGRRAVCDA